MRLAGLRRRAPQPPTWPELREGEAAAAVASQPMDYKRYHQARASSYGDYSGGRVLVVGCNRGEDCAYFVERGAGRVVGIDVMSEIGRNFVHPRARFVRASAERLPLPDAAFDLVFAYATLEHVPDIAAAFAEMARVAAPGGVVYSAAAPLWCCRSGPHWGTAFDHEPWAHLRMAPQAVAAPARSAAEGAHALELLTEPGLFNHRRAHEYLDACAGLDGIEILRNDIEAERQAGYDPAVLRYLVRGGYTAFDLFGMTHLFIARKAGA